MRRAAKGRTSANDALQFSLASGDGPSSETVSRVNGKSARCERSRGTARVVLRRSSLVERESTGFGEKLYFFPRWVRITYHARLFFFGHQRNVIARGVFTSVPDLARKLPPYINAY